MNAVNADNIVKIIVATLFVCWMAGFIWATGLMLTGNYPCEPVCYGDNDCFGEEEALRDAARECRTAHAGAEPLDSRDARPQDKPQGRTE